MTSAPPRTVTLPDGLLPAVLMDPEPVTAIRAVNGEAEHSFRPEQVSFRVGTAPTCEVKLRSPHVSQIHCELRRRGPRLLVQDLNSRNGTFFQGQREAAFDVGPGDTFHAASTELLVLNDAMRATRGVIAQTLGFDRGADVDALLVSAVQDWPMLIVGPAGAGHERLSLAIHEASHRRRRGLVYMPVSSDAPGRQRSCVESARRSTLVVHVNGKPVDELFFEMLLSPAYHLRVILIAPSIEEGARTLRAKTLSRIVKVELRPLAERRDELPLLIEHLFREVDLAILPSDLRSENLEALLENRWPGNLEELRKVVIWMAQIIRSGSVRAAAKALAIAPSNLAFWVKQMSLKLPLPTDDWCERHGRGDSSKHGARRP